MKVFCFQAHLHVLAEDDTAACDLIAEMFSKLHTSHDGMPDANHPQFLPRPSQFEMTDLGEYPTQ